MASGKAGFRFLKLNYSRENQQFPKGFCFLLFYAYLITDQLPQSASGKHPVYLKTTSSI
jgi:hypothetical protein